jgi:zinc transporter ZupT
LSKLNTNEKKSDEKKVESKVEEKKENGIAIAAYLNLVAHNFTDGLAIGLAIGFILNTDSDLSF